MDYIQHLKELEKSGKAVIANGDLNVAHKPIDIHDSSKRMEKLPGYTPEERASFDAYVNKHNFVDTFRS